MKSRSSDDLRTTGFFAADFFFLATDFLAVDFFAAVFFSGAENPSFFLIFYCNFREQNHAGNFVFSLPLKEKYIFTEKTWHSDKSMFQRFQN